MGQSKRHSHTPQTGFKSIRCKISYKITISWPLRYIEKHYAPKKVEVMLYVSRFVNVCVSCTLTFIFFYLPDYALFVHIFTRLQDRI